MNLGIFNECKFINENNNEWGYDLTASNHSIFGQKIKYDKDKETNISILDDNIKKIKSQVEKVAKEELENFYNEEKDHSHTSKDIYNKVTKKPKCIEFISWKSGGFSIILTYYGDINFFGDHILDITIDFNKDREFSKAYTSLQG